MKALLLIDVQKDFLRSGALAVHGADAIIPVINHLMPLFNLVIASKDWHPQHHVSFQSSTIKGPKKKKWPEHCILNTPGSAFPDDLKEEYIKKVFYKGTLEAQDSYSAFYIGENLQSTGLEEFLRAHNVDELYIAGIVLEYCVKSTAEDALNKDYKVWLIQDAIASFSLEDKEKILKDLQRRGAFLTQSNKITYENF